MAWAPHRVAEETQVACWFGGEAVQSHGREDGRGGVPLESLHWAAMSIRVRPETTARRALWLGGLLVILGGMFGMHGLDTHGVAGMDSHAHSAVSVVVAAPADAGHDGSSPAADPAQPVLAGLGDATTGHPAMDAGVAGACMAILAVALSLLLRLLRSGRVRPLPWVSARPARAPAVTGRDPDPPSLIRLSIQRC